MAIEHRDGYACAEHPELPVWSGLVDPQGPRRHFHGPNRHLECWGNMGRGDGTEQAPVQAQTGPVQAPDAVEALLDPDNVPNLVKDARTSPEVGAYVMWRDRHHGTQGHTGKFLGHARNQFRVQPLGFDGPARIDVELVEGWWEAGVGKHSMDSLIPNPARRAVSA